MMRVFSAPKAIVLMYHRVVDLGRDPFWLHVRPDHFVEHLDVLRSTCDVVPLHEIRTPGSGRRRVAITFDDGYDDNLAVAAPALADAEVPATVFIVSDLLAGTRAFWWDRLEHQILDGQNAGIIELDLPGNPLRVDLRTAERRDRALHALGSLLRPMSTTARESVLDQLAAHAGVVNGHCGCHAHLDHQGIVALANSPGISIGAHTRSHACLAALDPAAQRAEIAGSRRALESAVGRPVPTFAYPYGSYDSWNRSSVAAARDSGVRMAVTTITGDVSRTTSRFTVPRIAVRGVDRAQFVDQLGVWFRGGRTE